MKHKNKTRKGLVVVNIRRMLYAKQYSNDREEVQGLYRVCDQCNQLCDKCNQLCVCVCVVGAVNDGNCSLRWSATVSVVQESMWWKGNQIRDRAPPPPQGAASRRSKL